MPLQRGGNTVAVPFYFFEMNKAYMNWSGGKDSALALHHAFKDTSLQVGALFTSINAAHDRVSMHGVRRKLAEAQAAAIGLPLYVAQLPEQPSMTAYESEMRQRVALLKKAGYSTALFGDIYLEDLRQYREAQLNAQGISCQFPLWKKDPSVLMEEFLAAGFKAIVVCVNGSHLDPGFCGRLLNEDFLNDLPPGADPCGENGEYHSFVFDGPIFRTPVHFTVGESVTREYPAPQVAKDECFLNTSPSTISFHFTDLIPVA